MTQISSLQGIASASLCLIIFLGSSSGPASNDLLFTGSPTPGSGSESTCSVCHNSGSDFGEPMLSLTTDGNPITEYTPGQTYRMTVAVAASGNPASYGFQSVIIDPDSNESIGELSNPAANTHLIAASNGRVYAEHNAPEVAGNFSFDWTAPATGSGPVDVYIVGNAVNRDNATSGDNGSNTPLIVPLAERSALPLELTSFNGQNTKDTHTFTWSTSSETAFSHFDLQRAHEGSTFITFASIPGSGTVHETSYYVHEDLSPPAGTSHYRLRMVDTDGSFEFSPAISLHYNDASLSIFPNPVTDVLHLKHPYGKNVRMAIRTANGRVLMEDLNGQSVDLQRLPAGTYLLEVRDGQQRKVRRFIKR